MVIEIWKYFLFQYEMSGRIDALQNTLDKVRRETENEISRLREELLQKNETLERLQIQLKTQRDYEELKKQSRWVGKNRSSNNKNGFAHQMTYLYLPGQRISWDFCPKEKL